jgi:hypothetical protein
MSNLLCLQTVQPWLLCNGSYGTVTQESQMGDMAERTWAAMSYSWWASATINGVTYDAKCEAKLCSHALVAGTYAARLEGDNLYVYGETSDGKGRFVHFKIKRTMHPSGNPASN